MSEHEAKKPVALVTGARRGLGREACIALAARGYDIIGIDASMEEARDTGLGVIAHQVRFDFRLLDPARPEAVGPLLEWAWAGRDGVEILVIGAEAIPPEATAAGHASLALAMASVQRMVAEGAPHRGPRAIILLAEGEAGWTAAMSAALSAPLEGAGIPLLIWQANLQGEAPAVLRQQLAGLIAG